MAKKATWRKSLVKEIISDIKESGTGLTAADLAAIITDDSTAEENTDFVRMVALACADLHKSGQLWKDPVTGRFILPKKVKVQTVAWKLGVPQERRSIDDPWEAAP